MKTTHVGKICFLYIASLLITATPLWADSHNSANEKFATIQGYGNSVFWSIHPSVHFDSISLTLSSSDGSQVVIESEQEPSTSALSDGEYNYELVVTPSIGPSVRAELKAAREAAGGQEAKATIKALRMQGKMPQHRQVQSGYFSIADGQLVTADAAQE